MADSTGEWSGGLEWVRLKPTDSQHIWPKSRGTIPSVSPTPSGHSVDDENSDIRAMAEYYH